MDAIGFLLKEHDEIRKKISKITGIPYGNKKKIKLFNELCLFLVRHENMEHVLWYTNFSNKLKDLVKHLKNEEKSTEKMMLEFEKIDSEAEWEESFSILKERVEHHAAEEENELFPEVTEILDIAKLKEIGKKMQAFKKAVRLK